MNALRQFIRFLIETEKKDDSEKEKDLLTEPDEAEGREEDEVSVVASIAGVTTPLGTGPTYPDKPRKRRQSPAAAAGRSFGGATPIKKSWQLWYNKFEHLASTS